jgi:hypothetical protein
VIATTSALGYRQEYRRLGPGEHGYRRRVFRTADDVEMCAGPGTGPDYPPRRHPDWAALPREERLAVQAALDAADEHTGIADYLSERAGRDAVTHAARARGLDPRAWAGREADDVRREASQAEYEAVIAGDLPTARERLGRVMRGDRDVEALRRLVEITQAVDGHDLVRIAVGRPWSSGMGPSSGAVRWLPTGDWALGDGIVPPTLATLAGLRRDGGLGPAITDPDQVEAWRINLVLARAVDGVRARGPW